MAYVVPTIAQFKAKFPSFAAVADDVVQGALDEALTNVYESWIESDYAMAIMLYMAHVLTLSGYGTGAESQMASEGLLSFTQVRSGTFSFSRGASTSSGGSPGDDDDWYNLTIYGRRFLLLLKRSFPAIRVV